MTGQSSSKVIVKLFRIGQLTLFTTCLEIAQLSDILSYPNFFLKAKHAFSKCMPHWTLLEKSETVRADTNTDWPTFPSSSP